MAFDIQLKIQRALIAESFIRTVRMPTYPIIIMQYTLTNFYEKRALRHLFTSKNDIC